MAQYLMDTDHFTLYESAYPPLLHRLQAVPDGSVAIAAPTVQEALRGRFATLAKVLPPDRVVEGYARLLRTFRALQELLVLPYDADCEREFQRLRGGRLRVGTLDLRIAATALTKGLTVVTRNRRDFGQVPGLVVEDWSAP